MRQTIRQFRRIVDRYLKTVDSNWYRQRLNGTIYIVLAVFVLLIARLFYLQAIEGEEFRRLSENNSIRLQSIDPSRGLIFDRNGELLVDNRPSFDLSIVLKDARPVDKTLKKISYYTKIPLKELREKVKQNKNSSSYSPLLLKQDIGRDALGVVEAHKYDLPGTVVNIKAKRFYIHELSGAHLIGYLGEINADELRSGKYPGCRQGDFVGRFGVERSYEESLRGRRGGAQVEVNVTGQVVRTLNTVNAQPGHNIYLTIDQRLQKKTEALMANEVGAAVAIEPETGKILAMASSPTFDQNSFITGMSYDEWNQLVSNPFKPLQNKVIQGEYPPASTYKIITAMAGLEEKVIDEKTSIFCPGFYSFGDRVFKCWKKGGHGHVDMIKAIAESCDVYFYQVGQKLGIDRLARYAMDSGLGTSTKIELSHEAAGLVPTANWKMLRTGIPWQRGETLSIAIGQGYNLTTPLQMLILTAAVANGGTIYSPIILERIETADGRLQRASRIKPVGRLPVTMDTLEIVRKGLKAVVQSRTGTARIARIKGIDISGKTGTAQVVGRKDDEKEDEKNVAAHLKPHAWFVAYAPSEDPQIAVTIIVEHGEHGSSKASPIAREMIRTFLENRNLLPKTVAVK